MHSVKPSEANVSFLILQYKINLIKYIFYRAFICLNPNIYL